MRVAETTIVEERGSARRWAPAAAIVSLLLVVAARYAYVRIFGYFAPYDDEGYIMQTVRSYFAGVPLYDRVFSQYGPAFYLFQDLAHRVLRIPLTHEGVRFLTIAIWLASAALGAATVFRLTGSVLMTAMAAIQVFVHLTPLINEPGHPQAILIVAILLVCFISTRLTVRRAAACGAIVSFATLTKVNVGVYLLFSVAIPLAIASPGLGWLAWGSLAAAAVLPFAVLRMHLDMLFSYAAVVSAGIASVGVASQRSLRASLPDARPFYVFVISGLLTAVLLLLPSLLQGTSFAALVRAILIEPSQFASIFSVFSVPAILPPYTNVATALGIGLMIVFVLAPAVESPAGRGVVAVLKITWAFLVLPTSYGDYGEQLSVITPFAWMLLISGDGQMPGQLLFARAVLASTAVLQTLQAYPVAGSQIAIATAPLAVGAFVALDDALRTIAARFDRRGLTAARSAAAAVAICLLGTALSFDVWSYQYRRGYALRLPGAQRLHLSHAQVAAGQWLTAAVRSNCTALVTMPGLYSFNAWSGVAPPTSLNATAWMTLLTDERQQEIWSALARTPRPCAIFNRRLASNWLGGRPLESLASYQHLMKQFRTVGAAAEHELMLPANAAHDGVYPLVSDRQSFDGDDSALPVQVALLRGSPESTIRVWVRTRRRGTILACQDSAYVIARPPKTLPLLYIGRSGRLYGQHTTDPQVSLGTDRPVNDDAWHHVALVRSRSGQILYLDGTRVAAREGTSLDLDLPYCQLGIGYTTDWPDASFGWMAFAGEIDDLAVAPTAWGPEQIAKDWMATRSRH